MDKLSSHHWDSLLWLMRGAEECFKTIADQQVISRLYILCNSRSSISSSKFYGGIAFGTNVFTCCHTDADFTMSISQVFLKGKSEYHLHEDVVVYFCFPTLGVAVPLSPGDYLMFNALIPHCISSCCKLDDEIMCGFMYLKTSIVGLVGNSNFWFRFLVPPLVAKFRFRF
jgi:hypothetical protein